MRHQSSQSGFILPVVVSCILVVAIIAGGVLNYVLYGSRVTGVYTTASQVRLAAQTALDQAKVDIRQSFNAYYRANPSTWNLLSWFDSYSAQSIGLGGYSCTLMQNGNVNGYAVTVTIEGVEKSASGAATPFARVTLHAAATGKTPSGIDVAKTIEETV